MTTLVGLVSDQQHAEEIVNALAKIQPDEIDVRTIEKWPDNLDANLNMAPAFGNTYETTAVAAPLTDVSPLADLDDDEASFFKRNVQNGGVLIVVGFAGDKHRTEVERIFQKHDVRVADKT